MDIIIMGRQASGKGTQADMLADKGYIPFSTGDKVREMAERDTEFGVNVKTIMDEGGLISNEIIMKIVEDFINNLEAGKNIIFDGVPRNLEQADKLEEMLTSKGREYKYIFVDVDREECMSRLLDRKNCDKCGKIYGKGEKQECECGGKLIIRSDDADAEAVKHRMNAFNEKTLPVVDTRENSHLLMKIDGLGEIEEVAKRIAEVIN